MDGSGRRRARRVAPVVLSVVPQTLLAVALTAWGLSGRSAPAGTTVPIGAPGALYGALGLGAAATLLLLGRRPGPAVVVAGGLELAAVALLALPPLALLPAAVGVVRAMAAGARWWAVGTVAGMVLVPLGQLFLTDEARTAGRSLGSMLLLVVALGAGGFVRARRQRRHEEVARAEDRQRIAVEQERVRIARELHDVLAHSLSSISVQAGVGLHLAPERPQAATEALTAIRDASRSALDEVRGVLGVLRGDERAPLAPEPDLAALPALLADVRRTGGRVDLQDDLDPRPAPAVQRALLRIVQESLTNARRHAPGSAVTVLLRRHDGVIEARVRDQRSGARPGPVHAGNGILGMRERAAQLGGAVETVALDDGLEVVARIPEDAR